MMSNMSDPIEADVTSKAVTNDLKPKSKGRAAPLHIGTLSESVKLSSTTRQQKSSGVFTPLNSKPTHSQSVQLFPSNDDVPAPAYSHSHHLSTASAPLPDTSFSSSMGRLGSASKLNDSIRVVSASGSRSTQRRLQTRPLSPNPTVSTTMTSSGMSRPGTPNLNPSLSRCMVQKGSKVAESLSRYFHRMNIFTNAQLERFDWRLAACAAIPITAKDKETAVKFEQKKSQEKGGTFCQIPIDSEGMPIEDHKDDEVQAVQLQRFSMRIQLRKKKQKTAEAAAEQGVEPEEAASVAAGPKKLLLFPEETDLLLKVLEVQHLRKNAAVSDLISAIGPLRERFVPVRRIAVGKTGVLGEAWSIARREWEEHMKAVLPDLSPDTLSDIYHVFDGNDHGVICIVEFLLALSAVQEIAKYVDVAILRFAYSVLEAWQYRAGSNRDVNVSKLQLTSLLENYRDLHRDLNPATEDFTDELREIHKRMEWRKRNKRDRDIIPFSSFATAIAEHPKWRFMLVGPPPDGCSEFQKLLALEETLLSKRPKPDEEPEVLQPQK